MFRKKNSRRHSVLTPTTASRRVIFVSMIAGWGGSEELWSRAALDLVSQGIPVSACVIKTTPLHPRLRALEQRGVELWTRPVWYSWRRDFWRWLLSWRKGTTAYAVQRVIAARPPALLVLSDGAAFPPLELLEVCVEKAVPFVTLAHGNKEETWWHDDLAARHRVAAAAARRCFFVSRANLRLAEKQIGGELSNAEVVWNPVNISMDALLPWPPLAPGGALRFACVGRLDPPQKGQDILFEVLATPAWKDRLWRLYLYGDGNMRQSLEWLVQKLGLADRVIFAGHQPVEEIWAANHVLVMPSRFEGLPLAMVEAMLCARPVVATDVAGHAEVIAEGVTGFLADGPTVNSLAAALERFWARRHEAEDIGKAGARRIRHLIPPDPVHVFSERLKKLAGLMATH